LGYGKEWDGEFSNTNEVREASNNEVQILHKSLVLPEKSSSPQKWIKCEASPIRGYNSMEGMKTFSTCETDIKGSPKRFGNHPNVFFNYGKNGPVTWNVWSMYPHVFYVFNNHCMEKCWKIQSL
jgi:hypothetical protein